MILVSKSIFLFIFFVISSAAFTQPRPTQDFYVNDFANVISAQDRSYLLEKANAFYREQGSQVVVVTVPDMGGDEIAVTENRLAIARRNYNNSVSSFNIKLRVFPSSLFASSMGMMPKPFFEIPQEARERPEYDFGF